MGGHSRSGDFRLIVALFIALGTLLVEVIGGLLSNSLALLSDAGHVLVDVFAISLTLFAARLGARPHTSSLSYGYHRTEILASFVNGIVLVGVSLYIFSEAYRRILSPQAVQESLLLTIAGLGLVGNLAMMALLRRGRGENLNIKGAYLHVLGNTLSSLGVVIGGVVMVLTSFFLIDPIIAMIIGVIILRSAFNLIKESALILMERVPSGFDLEKISQEILGVNGVRGIHELHIWTLTSGLFLLSGHIVVEDQKISTANELLKEIGAMLKKEYGISHTTIQLESESMSLFDVKKSKDVE